MASLKFKDIKKMNKEEIEKKMKELKMELIKSRANVAKTGSSKIKQIKKIIAKMLMINSKHGNMS
jgi:ribosomal protein L29